MNDFAKREVAFERVIFFSGAIVTIAITPLARIDKDKPTGGALDSKEGEPGPIFYGDYCPVEYGKCLKPECDLGGFQKSRF